MPVWESPEFQLRMALIPMILPRVDEVKEKSEDTKGSSTGRE